MIEKIETLSISTLAATAYADWRKQKSGVYFGAKPYLQAMLTMDKISDKYGADDGKSIVAYFLSNATQWRGEIAKQVKAELKRRMKS